ncbi:hypothetical protein HBB16_04620 [Pseudonocardia sp. MCCB 268]|nr:hypothetical protein [Pseudonocardia cytotoxica]
MAGAAPRADRTGTAGSASWDGRSRRSRCPVGAVTPGSPGRGRSGSVRTPHSVYVFGVLELGNLHRELQQIAADASACRN